MTPITSVPSCLENFIGVRCLTTNPKSGLWINDLPGINLGYAADIVDRGGMSGLQFLQEKIDFATRLVIQEISGYSNQFFRISSIVDEIHVGDYQRQFVTTSAADRGVYLKVKKSRLLKIRINEIKLVLQNTNYTTDIEVDDGVNVTTYNVTTDGTGVAIIQPNYITGTGEVWITQAGVGSIPARSDVKTNCGCSTKTSKYISANGWNGTTASQTYGFSVNAVAECNYDEFACIIVSKLPFPILFKAGLEIVKEAITTDRLNSITLLDEDKVNFLLKNFNDEYERHMKMLVDSIPELMKRTDDCCVVCSQSKYVIGRP
jgi:hypothetical protein